MRVTPTPLLVRSIQGGFRRYAVRKGSVRSTQKFCYIVRRHQILLLKEWYAECKGEGGVTLRYKNTSLEHSDHHFYGITSTRSILHSCMTYISADTYYCSTWKLFPVHKSILYQQRALCQVRGDIMTLFQCIVCVIKVSCVCNTKLFMYCKQYAQCYIAARWWWWGYAHLTL